MGFTVTLVSPETSSPANSKDSSSKASHKDALSALQVCASCEGLLIAAWVLDAGRPSRVEAQFSLPSAL